MSKAYWPEGVETGCVYEGENFTTDKHLTKKEAEGVCRMLEEDGFGGGRKVFPVKTEVLPIK
jgi:hypothetical protein